MKTSELISVLQKALKDYGDNPVQIMNEESGYWCCITQIIKLHPYNGEYGCMNRKEPVNAIGIIRGFSAAKDLVLNK